MRLNQLFWKHFKDMYLLLMWKKFAQYSKELIREKSSFIYFSILFLLVEDFQETRWICLDIGQKTGHLTEN